jgi:alpha-galactosidase
MGNTWRVTNDIIPAWRTIPRILNQVVPQTSYAGPGHWLDLDMLEVGNNVFSKAEEQTHFSMWGIIKSPLIIGGRLKDSLGSINAASLAILKNENVISYNQDSLGRAASFRRRWTEDQYEIWTGPLSKNRTVAAMINWADADRELLFNLPDAGLQFAGNVKDIWQNKTKLNVRTSYRANVAAHGTMLLELTDTIPANTYDVGSFGAVER